MDTPDTLEAALRRYNARVGELLTERGWRWRRRDPELRKLLERLYGATNELLPYCGSGSRALAAGQRAQVEWALGIEPANLTLEAAIQVYDALDRILVDVGDERFICERIQGELQWGEGSTTWLTWDSMFGPEVPAAVERFHAGQTVEEDQLDAARHMLASLRRERSADYQVHRARLKMRARNLRVLAGVLLVLLLILGALVPLEISTKALVAVAGALGSAVSGTIKARDHLVRGSDLRAFHSGLWAQVALGAVAGLFVLMVLDAGLLTVAGVDGPTGWAAVAFAAGFSEPFWLRTVEHVARVGGAGDDTPEETSGRG